MLRMGLVRKPLGLKGARSSTVLPLQHLHLQGGQSKCLQCDMLESMS